MRFFRSLFRRGSAVAVAEVMSEEDEDVTRIEVRKPEGEVLHLDTMDRIVSRPRDDFATDEGRTAEITRMRFLDDEEEEDAETAMASAPEVETAPAPEPEVEAKVETPDAPAAPVEDSAADEDMPESGLTIDKEKSARRPKQKKGRVKTRLLGFDQPGAYGTPVEAEEAPAAEDVEAPKETEAEAPAKVTCPVGWIVVTEGEGMGEWFALSGGLASIGRGEDQAVSLNFGDTTISRSNHAALAYDATEHTFFLGDGGKPNSVRVNGTPVTGTQEVVDGDLIGIGDTTLRLVALCNKEFNWTSKGDFADAQHA